MIAFLCTVFVLGKRILKQGKLYRGMGTGEQFHAGEQQWVGRDSCTHAFPISLLGANSEFEFFDGTSGTKAGQGHRKCMQTFPSPKRLEMLYSSDTSTYQALLCFVGISLREKDRGSGGILMGFQSAKDF